LGFSDCEKTIQSMLASLKPHSLIRRENSGLNSDSGPTEGTCKWILEHPNYHEWRTNPRESGVIWVTGHPGCGKTILSQFVTTSLKGDAAKEIRKDVSICSYSFNGNQGTYNAVACLHRIIYQALCQNRILCHCATEFWESNRDDLMSWEALWEFWESICENAKSGEILWVIDALDEWKESEVRKLFLRRIFELVRKLNDVTVRRLHFRVFLTSRPEIWTQFKLSENSVPYHVMRLEDEPGIEDDIKIFIDSKVEYLAGVIGLPDGKARKLKEKLYKHADRTFLWPSLAIDSIQSQSELDLHDDSTWDDVLGGIPKALDDLYEKLLQQLSRKGPGSTTHYSPLKPKFKELLQVVLAADEHFTVAEMNILLAVTSQPAPIPKFLTQVEKAGHSIQPFYGSFVRLVTSQSGTRQVRLIHATAKDHLIYDDAKGQESRPESKSQYAMSLGSCHLELAKRCVWYLLLEDFWGNTSARTESGESKTRALAPYAISHWASHYRDGEHAMEEDDGMFKLVLGLYRTNSRLYQSWSQAFWKCASKSTAKIKCTPIQMCSYNGHDRILQRLLDDLDDDTRAEEINKKDNLGDTALHYATDQGYHAVVEVLLKAKASSTIYNKAGLTVLHKAAMENKQTIMKVLIDFNVNVDMTTTRETSGQPGRTALHIAAEKGLQDMVKLLQEKKANLELVDSEGSTAADRAFKKGYGQIQQFLLEKQVSSGITDLDRAIISGNEKDIQSLVKSGASIIAMDNRGSTPLHRAVRGDKTDILRFLLNRTTCINIEDDDGMTPLHVASKYGRQDAIELLIQKDAGIIGAVSKDGLTPLHEAAYGGHLSAVSRLLDTGANQEVRDAKLRTPLFYASRLGFDLVVETLLARAEEGLEMIPDDKGRLPLHIASKNGHKKTVIALLDRNESSVNAQDQKGRTPLSFAATGASQSHTNTIRVLIEKRADILHKQRDGAAPLLLAARSGNKEAIKCILELEQSKTIGENVHPDERNTRRSSPLSVAIHKGHEDSALLLLEYGARDVTQREGPGQRDPLSWAAGFGMLKVVNAILEREDIVVDSVDSHGRTALSWAAANGHCDVVTRLLQYRSSTGSEVSLDLADDEDRTPLSRAAGAGHKDVVEHLLLHNADFTTGRIRKKYHEKLGFEGRTPISWAAVEGHNAVISTFLEHEKAIKGNILHSREEELLSLAVFYGRTATVKFLLEREHPRRLDVNRGNGNGVTPLLLAAFKGYEEIVGLLLLHDADVFLETNDEQDSALTLAIRQSLWRVVQLLIAHDRKVLTVRTRSGESPLHLAVRAGSSKTVELLLQEDCDAKIPYPSTGNTLIHMAVEVGSSSTLMILLKNVGNHFNEANGSGETPIWIAAKKGYELCVQIILDYCRNCQLSPGILLTTDHRDCSLLSAAIIGGNAAIVENVLEIIPNNANEIVRLDSHGESPLTRASALHKGTLLRLLLDHNPQDVDQCDQETGRSPLLWAAYHGDEDTVKFLLENPLVNRYKTDKRQYTSLLHAVNFGHLHVVQVLLSHNDGKPQPRTTWLHASDVDGLNFPLQLAVKDGWTDLVRLFLEQHDLNLNQRNSDGHTSLLTAIDTGSEPLVRLLAEDVRVQTDVYDNKHQTPLMLACKGGHLTIVRYLLDGSDRFSINVNDLDNTKMSALSHAAQSGDNADIMKLLLESGALLNHTARRNRTPLMLAAESGSVQVARFLCSQEEVEIEAVDIHGFTALTIAATADKSNMVRFLLEKGANPNHPSRRSQRTPIMEAAYAGCVQAMRELAACSDTDFSLQNDASRSATWFILNGNAKKAPTSTQEITDMFLEVDNGRLNVNEVDIEGTTPLYLMASQNDRPSRIRRLLQLGADYKYQSWVTGQSAFHAAAKYATFPSMRELLYFNSSTTRGEEESADLIFQEDRTFDSGDLDHGTPLSYAAGNMDSELYAMLVDRGVVEKGVRGSAELRTKFESLLIENKLQKEQYRVVQLLISKGADVNTTTLKHRRTPLMCAAKAGWTRVVALLLNNGAKVNMKDKNYATALLLAAEEGHIVTVRRLLKSDASWNLKDKTGATPFIVAAKNGHLGIVKFLVETYRPNLNDRDRSGRTALSYAAECGRTPVVHYLLRRQAQGLEMVETLDRQDESALVWAAKKNRFLIIQLLMNYGANFRLKDRNNRMPLSHAAEYDSWQVINLLLGSILNWRDHAGRTALSWAAEGDRLITLHRLLERGADPSISDTKNRTPRMYALERGHTRAANVLETYQLSNSGVPSPFSNATTAVSKMRTSGEPTVFDEDEEDAMSTMSSSVDTFYECADNFDRDATITRFPNDWHIE
jgi:ankyrin repeat protein